MKKHLILSSLVAVISAASLIAQPLRITGSTTVAPVVEEAAEHLRNEPGLTIFVDTQGGSSGGIQAIASGQADLGMSSKRLTEKDPDGLIEHHIGEDAVALVVHGDVYEGGVQSITRAQAQGIYEGTTTNWKELGGPDQRIVFFNKEPGRGTWEVFATWLYGKASEAPPVNHPEVGSNEEVRAKVSSTRGAISQLSISWVDSSSIFALAIRSDSDEVIPPTPANIAAHHYPLSRPLFVLTHGAPNPSAKTMIDYLLSEPGQKLVQNHGYLTLADLTDPE